MSGETIVQDEQQLERSRALSSVRPPAVEVPGFRLERPLGRGAFGEVWLAVEPHTGRRVAIKFFSRHRGLDWPLLRREVGKLVEVSTDRRIVNLLQVGQDAEHPYYVMEYLEGGSLADRLAAGPMPAEKAIRIFRMVVEALIFLHGKAVLHCDLKPGNVLLDGRDEVRLADFGQARLSQEDGPGAGTLFFMAPEQADPDARPDVQSDIYSLGALFYAMLTGRPPHTDSIDIDTTLGRTTSVDEKLVAYRELLDRTPAPTDHHRVPGVDETIANIVDRCLHHDPDHRFENVAQILAELDDRDRRRTQRPLLLFGLVGPLVLLAAFLGVGWWLFHDGASVARGALVEQTLEAHRDLARLSAAALDRDLDAVKRRLDRAASDPELTAAARDLDVERLIARMEELYASYEKRSFRGWTLRLQGGLRDDLPELRVPAGWIQQEQAWRDPEAGVLVPLSAPLHDGAETFGVLNVALELDAFQEWLALAENPLSDSECPDVRILVLRGDQLLRHPCPSPDMPSAPVGAEHFAGHDEVRTLINAGESKNFRDPLRPSEFDLAAAISLHHHPEWTVIASRSRDAALSSLDRLTGRLLRLGVIAVGLGILVLSALLYVLSVLSRRSA